MKIGFIGPGKMAQAIIAGFTDAQKSELLISGRSFTKTQEIGKSLGLQVAQSNQELVKKSDLIILSVKPQVIPLVLSEISTELIKEKTLISVAAGLDLKTLEDATNPKQGIIRVMPNVNAAIGRSTSAIVRNNQVLDEIYDFAKSLFLQVGTVHEIAEKDFSSFAAIAGSSPAFIYMFIDALAKAGVLHGLPKETALQIVAETVAASAENVIQSPEHPLALADSVASPGGTTIEGIVALENHGFNAAVIDAVSACIRKEKTLSN